MHVYVSAHLFNTFLAKNALYTHTVHVKYEVHKYNQHHHLVATYGKIQLPLIATLPSQSHPITTLHVTVAATKLCF